MWGRDPSRNMVSPEKGLPLSADIGKPRDGSDDIDPATVKNIKWVAKLGSDSWGNVTVAGGRVFIGTNNASPRDPRYKGDYGILLCLDEATGKLLWQLAAPKLAAGNVSDYAEAGLCSCATVEHTPEGDRVYLVTNRCEVLCLNAAGMANGNQGPFRDEAQYTAGPGKPPIPSGPNDADIIWRYDLRDELGVFPHQMTSSSTLLVGDRLYVTTSNGVDWHDKRIPSPQAPALVCLDKKTGKLLGEEKSGISARTLFSNWSSPAFGVVGGKPTVVFGGGDGFCYGFDPVPADGVLKELWRFDCNPPERKTKDGKPRSYGDPKGPGIILSTPVVFDGKVFVATGHDPNQDDPGAGCLSCIDASNPANPKAVWQNKQVSGSVSTVAIADGLLYFADAAGRLYCMDELTGKPYWTQDNEEVIWGSPLVADGKIYIGNRAGELDILAAGKEKKELGKIDFGQAVMSTPVAANGVLYVATGQNLYTVKGNGN